MKRDSGQHQLESSCKSIISDRFETGAVAGMVGIRGEDRLGGMEPTRSLEEPIVRLILDGMVARMRLDRTATSISLLVVLGVRADGQRIMLAAGSMGGASEAAWRGVLDDLVRRGLRERGQVRLKHSLRL